MHEAAGTLTEYAPKLLGHVLSMLLSHHNFLNIGQSLIDDVNKDYIIYMQKCQVLKEMLLK